jgi:hypothetical protein
MDKYLWKVKFPAKPLYKEFRRKFFLIKILRQDPRGFIRNFHQKHHRLDLLRIIA